MELGTRMERAVWGALGAMLFATAAIAQTPAPSAADSQNNGVKVGDARLHPSFDLQLNYDSAAGVFYDPLRPGPTSLVSPELVTHFRPGLKLDLPGGVLAVDAGGHVDYVLYTGLITPASRNSSRLEAAGNVTASLNPNGTVELSVGDQFSRSDRTSNPVVGIGVLSLYNEARLGVPIRPGGGALELTPEVKWQLEFFRPLSSTPVAGCPLGDISCDPALISQMNYSNWNLAAHAKLKFLPKTALTLDTGFDIRDYSGGTAVNLRGLLLKTTVGLVGLVTQKLAVVAKLGWAQDFAGSGARALIAQADVNYLLSETANLKLGYLRNIDPVPTLGAYRNDRIALDTQWLLGGKLTLVGRVSHDVLTFYRNSNRTDRSTNLGGGPEYQFRPWLIGALGYSVGIRSSNGTASSSVNFARHEAFARVTFTY
jgi:hypothetical protein